MALNFDIPSELADSGSESDAAVFGKSEAYRKTLTHMFLVAIFTQKSENMLFFGLRPSKYGFAESFWLKRWKVRYAESFSKCKFEGHHPKSECRFEFYASN